MGTNTKGQQLVQSISFEVEAIPEENTVKVRSPANMTPVNVKIRVRKKEESDVHKGVISVPRFGPVGSHERIRLVSSDQTIMSFNILMEADFERKPLRKPRKRFFGGCLGTSTDDDDGPYVPTKIETRESKSDTGIVSTKLMLAPNNGDDYASYIMEKKNKKIFGKCKPGGCLDPPFNEDKYSYLPTTLKQPLRMPNDNLVIVDNPDEKYIETQGPGFGISVLRKKRENSSTSTHKTSDTADLEDRSVLNLYPVDDKKTTLSDNDSDHIITYPTESSSSHQRIDDEKKRHSRNSSASKSRKSFAEINTPYFVPPKRDSTKSSSRDEYFKDINDRNITTLRKIVTKDKTPSDYESNRQESTISIKKIVTSKMNISQTTDYIEPFTKSSNLGEIQKKLLGNVGTRSSFSKNKTGEPESNDYLDSEEQQGLKERSNNANKYERVPLSKRSHLPSPDVHLGNMPDEQTANVSIRRDTAKSLNSSNLLHDHNLYPENDIDKKKNGTKKFGSAPKSKLSDDKFSNVDAIHPPKRRISSVDNQQDNVTVKPDGHISDDLQHKKIGAILDTSSALRTASVSDLNYGKYSTKDKASKDSKFDGGKDTTAKQQMRKSEQLDSNDPYSVNGFGSSYPNFRKHSSLIKNYEASMDAEQAGRNAVEKIRSKDLSLTENKSDSKLGFKHPKKDNKIGPLAINALGSPSYRKQSSSIEKDKFTREYDDRNEKDEIKPKYLVLPTNTDDLKEDLKQNKQKDERLGPHATGSSSHDYRNHSSFTQGPPEINALGSPSYRKHLSSIEKDKFTRENDINKKDEIKSKYVILPTNADDSQVDLKQTIQKEERLGLHTTGSSGHDYRKRPSFLQQDMFKDAKSSDRDEGKESAYDPDSKVYNKQHKDYNLELQNTINARRSPDRNDMKQDKFTEDAKREQKTEDGKPYKPVTNASDAKDVEMDLKKRGDYEDLLFGSNAELTLKPNENLSAIILQKDQHPATDKSEMRNETAIVAKRNIPQLVTKSSNDEENKASSRKTLMDDDKLEINKTGENGIKLANSGGPEVLSDTLRSFPETQQDLTAVREDTFKQNQIPRTTGPALGSAATKEEILRKLPEYYNENKIMDAFTAQAGSIPDNLNNNIITNTSGTEMQISKRTDAGQDVEMTKSKETLPTDKNIKTVDTGNMQKETSEGVGGAYMDIKTSFNSKDSFQDEYSKKREIVRKLKETDSNKTINHFDGFLTDHDMQETDYHNIDADSQRQQKEMKQEPKVILFKPRRSNDRDSILLDLAFTSFSNAQNERTVKSLETSVDTKSMDNVIVVKTAVKSDSKDIRIPIDYDTYMSIKIKKARKESDRNKSDSSSLDHVERKVDSRKLDARPRANILKTETVVAGYKDTKETGAKKEVDNNILQETLSAIYEKELVPLQNTIKSLKDDIDVLADQQIKYRDSVHGLKVLRCTRLVHSNKRCGCIRK